MSKIKYLEISAVYLKTEMNSGKENISAATFGNMPTYSQILTFILIFHFHHLEIRRKPYT